MEGGRKEAGKPVGLLICIIFHDYHWSYCTSRHVGLAAVIILCGRGAKITRRARRGRCPRMHYTTRRPGKNNCSRSGNTSRIGQG
eukprot:9287291-Pyramimonas_sp.AAC.1